MEKIWVKKIVAGSFFVLILSFLVYGGFQGDDKENEIEPITSLFKPSEPIADFTLPSVSGNNYTFSSDNGKIRFVTFIYTKCPDEVGCAVITTQMKALEAKLGEQGLLNGVKFVSIDFDYIGDTMDDLRSYANLYTDDYSQWDFLLGSENQTNQVAEDWEFFFQRINSSDLTLSHDGTVHETYTHPLRIYVIDDEGYHREDLFSNIWNADYAMEVVKFLKNE